MIKFDLLAVLTTILLKCALTNDEVKRVLIPKFIPITNEVDFWLTKADQSVKLQKQAIGLSFGTPLMHTQILTWMIPKIFKQLMVLI